MHRDVTVDIVNEGEYIMMSDQVGVLIAFFIYLMSMLLIGLIYYRKTENLSDYVLGGRSLNGWVTALSAQASDMSGWLLLGLPGYAYASGLEAIWIAIGLGVGTYLNWKFIAKRLRKYTEAAGDSLTLSEYFQNRFHDSSNVLRVASAIVIFVFFTIYTASGLVAGGKLFSTVFDIPYMTALTVGALVVISYTFLGGFMAVCWTDFFQGLLMLLALIIVPYKAFVIIGGMDGLVGGLTAVNPNTLDFMTSSVGEALSGISIISLLAWGLGYFGQPHILTRFMAISSASEIKKARRVAMVWVTISLFAALVIGLVGRVFLDSGLASGAEETVFMVMVGELFPSLLAGFLLAAILAAIMSTADSQLLVTSSALTEDIYRIFKREASEKELLMVSRMSVVGVAIIAYIFAMNPQSSVLDLVSYAWAGFGAGFGPTVIMSLFWKRMNKNGALAGIIVGGLTVLIWKQLSGGIFDLYEIVPGMIASFIAIYVGSLMSSAPAQAVQDQFDSVTEWDAA